METYQPNYRALADAQIKADLSRFMLTRFAPAAGVVLGVLFIMAIW